MQPASCRTVPPCGPSTDFIVRWPLRHLFHLRWMSVLVIGVAVASQNAICQAAIRAEAYRGEPFGMGRVRVDLPADAPIEPWKDDRFTIVESQERVIYPVLDNQQVRRVVRRLLGIGAPWRVEFYFMFRGDAPLDLTVYAPDAERIVLEPEADAEAFQELLDDWWDATADRYQQIHREAAYPIVVENYVTANWARRLDRRMPEPRLDFLRPQQTGGTWIAQLTAGEAYQMAVERDLILGRFGGQQSANVPLPEPPLDEPLVLPIPPAGVEIEPLASHVPQECFYMRFGNFPNYLWFRDFLRHWQGDLTNMLVLRSIDRNAADRFQQQIAVGESKIARVMGPTVIADAAIIGLDAYLREGAAMGIMFHANNSALLRRNLSNQRHAAMERVQGASEETLKFAGNDVSYISSPDGQLRSYYAIDGDFHLVTTSRQLIKRFFEAGRGEGSLGQSAEFQHARSEMPLARDDTVFVYLSNAFFENLASPHYRVELDRRLRSIGQMRTLRLARLAARAEGRAAESTEELIDAELLPTNFTARADDSELIETDDTFRDSVRGVPGWFVPIADVPVESITPTEGRRYLDFRRSIQSEVGRFVPVIAAFQRLVSDDGELDRIIADVRLAPYSQTRLAEWTDLLGPPETLHVAPIEGDVVSGEVVWGALGEPVHLFGGLRDSQPPLIVREGEARPTTPLWQAVRGYVGAWPRPHLFDRFFGRPTEPFDDDGIARNDGLFELWQRRLDDFFLFSFKRDVLLEVGPQLAMIAAERPAQVRVRIDDLSDKRIATTVSGFGYTRARDTSASGSRFMNSLVTQLNVPADDARELAEDLVGGRFVCPLGGEYRLLAGDRDFVGGEDGEVLPEPGGRALWASTATPPENRFMLTTIPADFEMPFMEWFRGLSADVARHNNALMLHAELDMVHQELRPPTEDGEPDEGGFKLPALGELFKTFGGSPTKKDDAVEPAAGTEETAEQ